MARNRLAPRIRIHRDGTATLSGIQARDLQSILTASSIHHFDTEKEHRERRAEIDAKRAANQYGLGEVAWQNYLDSGAWIVRIRNLLTMCEEALKGDRPRCAPFARVLDLKPVERMYRRREVEEARRDRIWLDEVVEEAIAERRKAVQQVSQPDTDWGLVYGGGTET